MAAPFLQQVVCPVLIGRIAQRDALCQFIDSASDGHGQIVLISGEAGVGKSRLVAEAKAYAAARGLSLLQGNCFPQDSACAYAPLLDLLRTRLAGCVPLAIAAAIGPFARELAPLLPDLASLAADLSPLPALDPEQQKRRLFEALAYCLTRRITPQPILLIVEDLHWSDESSLDFLLYLVRRAAQPLVLIGTYRDDEVSSRLRHWLAQLDRERLFCELPVAPLTRDEVAAMLRAIFALNRPARAEFLDAIYTLTEGNPFYVEELLKSLVATGDIFYADGTWERKPIAELHLPPSLHDAVQQRVAQLSSEARKVLALAAVVGRRFDFTLLQHLAQLDEDALLQLIKELIAAQLVVEETAEQFAFRHALTRQAIEAELLARERTVLHRTIAEMTERIYADSRDQRAADLAYHFDAAGVWDQALEYARRAGERAQALGAPYAALVQYTRALEAAGKLAMAPDPEIYLGRGHAYETLGDFERARADYEQALRQARNAQDSMAEWRILVDLGLLWASRDYAQTGEWLHRALDLARQSGEWRMLARSLNRLGNWHVNVGQVAEGLQLHEQALALFEAQGDRQGMVETLDLLGMANGLYGDILSSVQWYGRAIELYRELGDSAGLSSALAARAAFASSTTEPVFCPCWPRDDCMRDVDEALRLAIRIDWLAGQVYAEIIACQVLDAFGDFGAALAHGRTALQIATGMEHREWIAATCYMLGATFIDMFAPDPAIHQLLFGLSAARDLGSEFWAGEISAYLAQAYLLSHDLPGAEAVLTGAMLRDRSPDNLAERRVALGWGELALAQGAPDGAFRIAEQLIESAPGVAHGQPIPVLLKLKGEALLALGRPDVAAPVLAEAAHGAKERGALPLLWQILRALGQAHQRLGQKREAQHAFAEASVAVDSLAATIDDAGLREGFLRAARETLPREKPLTARRAAAARFGGLTAREREVAKLIGRGCSNRAIAETLTVSEKTVETHVSNILAKLGCASRLQIATWAIGAGLLDDSE